MTPLSSDLMAIDSKVQIFQRKKLGEGESLRKLLNSMSTMYWFSISLSLFLNFSNDGLKLGSSFQHFVITSYLKHKDIKNILV